MGQHRALSAETRLLLACCRPVQAPDRVGAIRDAARVAFDPARLVAHSRNHRIEGFVHQGLRAAGVALPDAEAALLDDRARRARVQMLRNAAEEVRVTRALDRAGVDVVSLKGSSLSMMAHGTLGLKSTWDIDLLVRPEARAAAEAVLGALGYRVEVMDGRRSPREIERYAVAIKEMVWRHPGRGTAVELHRALFNDRAQLAEVGMDSRRVAVDLPGAGVVTTLAPGPLFAYVTMHGALHGWIRAKWLADLAGLIHAHGDAVEGWHRDAVAVGAGRAPAIALLLSHRLLGTDLPPAARTPDRATRRFVAVAERLIDRSRSDSAAVLQPTRAQLLAIMTLPWRLGSGSPWRALTAPLRRPDHPDHLKVPPALLPFLMLGWLPMRLVTGPFRRLAAAQRGGKVASRP